MNPEDHFSRCFSGLPSAMAEQRTSAGTPRSVCISSGVLRSAGSNRGVGEFAEYTIHPQPEELQILGLRVSRVAVCKISALVPESESMDEQPQLVGIINE